jgi:hypothetical protein
MSGKSNLDFDASESAWYEKKAITGSGGLRVADTLDEVKTFAYQCFDQLDRDGNGFLSKAELTEAINDDRWKWREKSFICFLLRRITDISESYDEEWDCKDAEGISRSDIQEYFHVICKKISGG